jgi:hypothetical protein
MTIVIKTSKLSITMQYEIILVKWTKRSLCKEKGQIISAIINNFILNAKVMLI